MSSNVIVKSNVYVNPSGRRDDPVFLTHITDYRVLKRYESHGGLIRTDAWMTPTQRQILELGQPKCAYEKGSMSWGVPVGGTEMVCRCEQYDCHRYSICSQAYNFQPIKREKATEVVESAPRRYSFLPLYPDLILNTSPEATESKEEKHEITEAAVPVSSENSETASIIAPEPDLGIKHEESPLLATNSSSLDEKKSEIIETEKIDAGNSELVDQETIIQAPIHSRIWVNAGPGTGKTYTVIKRIRFLLENENDGTILVLCFSRNAVQEIRTRLTAEIGHKVSYLIEDGALIIRTFDSFASYMLEDELNTAWDYDERIEAFIRTIKQNKSELDNMFDYLIVDELQDTVGVRARMLLELMNSVSCGVLLLGDRCQAIFDWTIRDQDDMTFEQLAGELNHTNIRRYELEGNRRQEHKLDQMGQQLRTTMLKKNEQEQEAAVNQFKDWIRENWKSYELSGLSQVLSGSSDLVLCKTNGEASYVSQELFDSAAQIEHIMKQSSRHRALAAWIAKVLYGNDGQYIDHAHFMKNADDYCVDDPDKKWKILKDLDGHPHAEVIHIPEVLAALTHTDSVPEECISHHDGAAIVSTVHRAKGSEAEHVYWVDSPLVYENHADQEGTLGDAIKAAYVAVTRAKKDIRMLQLNKKRHMKLANDHRWIYYSPYRNRYGTFKTFCKGIAMLPEDVDYASFVQSEDAHDRQLVLSSLVPGLPVELFPDEQKRRFDIYCDGQQLGSTSPEFTKDLFDGFEATNGNENWPVEIKEPFIADIITVVAPERVDINNEFRKMGCWLGIELGGFPMIEYGNYR